MAKAKARKGKTKVAKKAPAKAKAPAKSKKSKKAKTNLFGGMAKGLAWLGDKVRGVVKRKKKTKKTKRAAKPKVVATATPVDENPMP
jgi:hypothetical protein